MEGLDRYPWVSFIIALDKEPRTSLSRARHSYSACSSPISGPCELVQLSHQVRGPAPSYQSRPSWHASLAGLRPLVPLSSGHTPYPIAKLLEQGRCGLWKRLR